MITILNREEAESYVIMMKKLLSYDGQNCKRTSRDNPVNWFPNLFFLNSLFF